jgi:thiopeptide-type bacteriocin biosynthesis protein
MTADFAMARIALLSVEEAADRLSRDDAGDDLIRTVVDLAWGSPDGRPGPQPPRPHDTTMRYIARMGGRATPFGLLAGTRHMAVGPDRHLHVGPRDRHRARIRVDFEVLQRLVAEAIEAADPDRRPLRRNRTLRRHAGGLRYMKSGDATADLVSVRSTAAIEALLDIVGEKTLLAGELLDALEERFPGTSRPALRMFVENTVASELLSTALDLVRPGDEPIELALSILDRIGDQPRAEALADLGAAVRALHRIEPALSDHLDAAFQRILAVAPSLADVSPNRRFHLDLEMDLTAPMLDQRTVQDLTGVVRRLEKLFGRPAYLPEFRKAFRRRYEDAEVSLLEALDLENGVLRPRDRNVSPLAEQAEVTMPPGRHPAEVPVEVLRLFGEWAVRGGEIDISGLPGVPRTTARGLLASLLDNHESRFDSMLTAGYQRTSLALIARFVVGREEMTEVVRAWSDEGSEGADDPDAPLHAELVYSPGGRISNALIRPRVFQHDVALDGGGDGSLALERLRLRLDGDALRLRDSVTGRDVILEMNCSHNVGAPGLDPIYTTLGMMVSPGAVGWSWGQLSSQSHLPRVVCGRVIVAPEIWNITGAAVKEVLTSADPPAELRRRLPGLGKRRFVGVGEDDRLLPVDVDSARSIELALTRLAKDERVELIELPHLESPAAAGPTGRHVCEVTVPLRREEKSPPRRLPVVPFDPQAGASWVYFKLYCGPSAADTIAARIAEHADRLNTAGQIDDWFFLRYFDEGFHVRVRMRPSAQEYRPAVLTALDRLATELRQRGLVTRAVMDEYIPEVARYGGYASLRKAEALFTADSAAVARLVAAGPSEQVRLYQCVADILGWTDTLFDTPDRKRDFLRRCRSGLGLEYGATTRNVRGRFFRKHRAELKTHLASASVDGQTLLRLTDLVAAAAGSVPLPTAASVLHMHCNRLFTVDSRRLEFLAYDLADRKMLERRARSSEPTPESNLLGEEPR